MAARNVHLFSAPTPHKVTWSEPGLFRQVEVPTRKCIRVACSRHTLETLPHVILREEGKELLDGHLVRRGLHLRMPSPAVTAGLLDLPLFTLTFREPPHRRPLDWSTASFSAFPDFLPPHPRLFRMIDDWAEDPTVPLLDYLIDGEVEHDVSRIVYQMRANYDDTDEDVTPLEDLCREFLRRHRVGSRFLGGAAEKAIGFVLGPVRLLRLALKEGWEPR